jgi:hypothetical protein
MRPLSGNQEGRICGPPQLKLMEDFFVSDDVLPIKTLISNRCDALSLRLSDLVRRCGYKNISKGLRRLESVQQGCFKGTRH